MSRGAPPPEIPLARLTATATRTLIDALHERLAARGYRDVRPSFGFVLLETRRAPMSVNDVAALMGITKQAASKIVDNVTRAGYVRRVADAEDARTRRIELTPRGRRLLETVEQIYAELETEWSAAIGRARFETMRRDLTAALLALHGGALPAVRPTW